MKQQFIKVHSFKDIAIFLSITLIGIILALLPYGMGLNIAGCILIICGIALGFILKSAYREINNPGIYHKKEFFFEPKHKDDLLRNIQSNPSKINLSEEGNGLSVRLDLYYSSTSSSAFLQLFEYVPYEYVAVSEVVECDKERVKQIIK